DRGCRISVSGGRGSLAISGFVQQSHFEISARNRRQLFETGSPMTDIYKRRKLGPILEVARVLDEEWWPSIQPFTNVDLRSDADRLKLTDATE
ncbi:hypothetical protein Q4543_10180, partial [Salipiger sp. 1_MG-2023]|uniref:hypothetical protein n=1 Tax=Salipiger sp. 1_MG-2023 TaxID=3062665 RepID=UPI0026E19A06